jgi:GH18 family chitinase
MIELSAAVAGLEDKSEGIHKDFIQAVDYLYVMAFVNDSCFNCGGPNHSSLFFAKNSFMHWTTGLPERNITGKQADPSKIILAIPFFDNDGAFYNEFSKEKPQHFFADEDGHLDGYFYNSCPMIQEKSSFIQESGGAGLFSWEVVQDRHDNHSLLKCMYDSFYGTDKNE